MKNMKQIASFYIDHSALIGFILFLVPVLILFGWVFISLPFRDIYALRFILTITVGGAIAALVHRYGISLWYIKHVSSKGPAGIVDGFAIGSAVGFFMSAVPSLFSLIQTNHPEETKTFIIATYLGAALMGGLLGGIVSGIGKNFIPRKK